MEHQNEKEVFNYTYSAKQHSEIENIRKKYMPAKEDKMEQLRRLDRETTQKGTMISIIIGVIGALIFGTGMCCCMVWTEKWFVPGVIIGIFGIGILSAAYPLHSYITKKEREKIAPEIIRLTEELMN